MSEIERIEAATHEEIITGDFVRLASGGPVGIVRMVRGKWANVTWLTAELIRDCLPWVCLRQAR